MNLQAKFHYSTVNLLLRIKREFPSAIIAGGAVRDLCLGRDIKDIDVFISGDKSQSVMSHLKRKNFNHWIHNPTPFWQNVLGDSDWKVKRVKNGYGKPDPHLDVVLDIRNPSVSHYYKHYVPKIDVIFLLKPALDYFNQDFDFNICKAYFDGNKFSFTSGFMKDIRKQTITLTGPLDIGSINYSLKNHLPRIKAKYPNFKVVIPYEYQDVIDNYTIPF